MTTTETEITITPVAGAADLLCIYPREQAPQPCYVALDIRTGRLWADYNSEIGNAVPSDVWHGLTRRYEIPPMSASVANALMEQLRPLAQRVYRGADDLWNGHNRLAVLDVDAAEAEAEIEDIVEREREAGRSLHWWEAADWFSPITGELREALAAGRTVDELVNEYDGDGLTEDHPVVIGIREYLDNLSADVTAEADEAN